VKKTGWRFFSPYKKSRKTKGTDFISAFVPETGKLSNQVIAGFRHLPIWVLEGFTNIAALVTILCKIHPVIF
jgi:hypothetical protein